MNQIFPYPDPLNLPGIPTRGTTFFSVREYLSHIASEIHRLNKKS